MVSFLLMSFDYSVHFSISVVSHSLWPNGLEHACLPCLSPTPGACSKSCPLTQWCHPTISSSVVHFSSCLQLFQASWSFPMSQFFPSGGQSVGASASASVFPINIQDWFPLGLTGLISLQSKGLSRVFSKHHSSKASVLQHSAFIMVQLSHPYMTTRKTIALTAAVAAKSCQLCPTLCDPIDGSPPGSPIPGILQARTLEWVAIAFSKAWKWKLKVKYFSRVPLFATPWTAAYQVPPSMGFSRPEYWSGVPSPSP